MARHAREPRPKPYGPVRADFYGPIASFWLVFFGSIPAALPFLFRRPVNPSAGVNCAVF